LDEVSRTSEGRARHLTGKTEAAFSQFLREHAGLILQVVNLFERDVDRAEDCFLFVCERLRRDDMRRIRRFRREGTASFPTWLRAVVRHLCLDWRRHRHGRFRLPRAVAQLSALDQEVFRCVHVRHLSENETFHVLNALWPGLDREQLGNAVERVEKSLRGRQSWLILTHRPRLESLSAAPESDPAETEPALVDPQADPERDAATHQRLEVLRNALCTLPPRARLLLQLRFEQDLTLEEVAHLTGLSSVAQVERQIQQALTALREALGAQGQTRVSVKGKWWQI
jgi:RNA polymerase sigma factor (sigma-70 family)